MKTCPKCGAENPPFNDVCRLCDAPLAVGSPSPAGISASAPPSALRDDREVFEVLPLGDSAPARADILEVNPMESESPPLAPKPVPAPKWLRVFGVISILLGIIIPLVNFFFVKEGIDKFIDKGFSEDVVLPLWINIGVSAAIGLYLLISGFGLMGPTLWGRRMSMLFIGIAILGAIIAVVNGSITKVMAEEEFRKKHENSYFASFQIKYFAAAPFFPPGYAALLLVFSMIPPVRDWARGTHALERGATPELAWAPTAQQGTLHTPAMLSMVFSMIPFLLITQVVSLIMGIVAIRTINRSGGKLSGKGYAWAGIVISSLILGCIGSILGVVAIVATFAPKSHEDRRSPPGYYYDQPYEKSEKARFDD